MSPPAEPRLTALLLAGGRGTRLGGTEKALLRCGEQTQLRRWLQQLHRHEVRTVVVGPESLRAEIPPSTALTQERPAFAGPAAGILAGAAALRSLDHDPHPGTDSRAWTMLLAVDLVTPAGLLDWLIAGLRDAEPAEAVLPSDEDGRHQYLSAAVPTGWLLRRTQHLTAAEAAHRPVRWLLQSDSEPLVMRHPVIPAGLGQDVDTPADAHRLGIRLP